ncbi:MAG: ABC transporter permease [Acholeplasmataceae bacterium]
MRTTNKWFSRSYFILIVILTYLPILSLVIFSFNEGRSITQWTGFSFKWYVELFQDSQLIDAIVTTLMVAIISTAVSTVIGTFAALGLSKSRRIIREITLGINNIPILSPEIITAIALFIFFGAFAIDRGLLTMILAHIGFSTPYVILTVYPKVKSLDPNLTHAAYDLGATPGQALFKVILPQIKVAVIAGAAIAFTMSFDDFVISYFTSSGYPQNISMYLYTLRRGIVPTVNALSTFIILIIGVKIVYDYVKSYKKLEEE